MGVLLREYRDKLQNLGITLTKTGKQTCPQCSHTRKNKTDPCLSVTYTDTAVLYKCHNCGWSGVVYYRDKFESKKNYKRPEVPKVKENLDQLYNYFIKRGISPDIVKKYDLSLSPKNEIIFPYYKYGELVNLKYRTNLGNGKKTFRQEQNSEKTLFGMDLIPKDEKTLIWVEGEIDVLSFAQQGIYSVSIPQGASENKLECIENCFEFIEKFETHIIAVDNDVPGDNLKLNLLNRLGREKCKLVNWKQYKDANEALLEGCKLNEFIDNAEDIAPEGIISFSDCFDEIYKYNFEKDINFYETPWKSLNNIIKLRTGHLMIVTGYPSRGKSTFIDNLLMYLSKKYDLRHIIASFEATNAKHFNSLIEMYNEVPIYKIIQDNINGGIFGEGYEFISEHFYRFDINKQWSVEEICERVELAVRKYGVKVLVIDPYNRLKNDYKDREDKYIGDILSKLQMLAKKLDMLIIFAAHPKKPDGEKIPNMYSISGSADWYNMADYGIVVHRDRNSDGKLSNIPTIAVQKVKDFSLGNPSGGVINLYYNTNKRILEGNAA